MDAEEAFVAFSGELQIASGALPEVALAAKRAETSGASVLVFDAATGAVKDLDLRGTEAEVLARHAPGPIVSGPVVSGPVVSRRGRPKLGVTAREVTLLPRHWDWLAAQPGGASVALRRLVEAASRTEDPAAAARARNEAAYRFMSVMAGDRPGFEEACRALFSGDRGRLAHISRAWPKDIRERVLRYLGAD